jgi:hypothetical protein
MTTTTTITTDHDRGYEYALSHRDTIDTIAADAKRIYEEACADATASGALLDARQAMRDALAAGDLARARVLADDWTRGRIDAAEHERKRVAEYASATLCSIALMVARGQGVVTFHDWQLAGADGPETVTVSVGAPPGLVERWSGPRAEWREALICAALGDPQARVDLRTKKVR